MGKNGHKHAEVDMALNERLQQVLEQAQGIKPFNYDYVFRENNELKKKHNLFQVKLKALIMEKKDAYLWWDVVQDTVQKDVGKVCKMYERNEKLYRHKISQMEKFIPFFQYESLILILESKTSNEEEERGQTDGARPSDTEIAEEELTNLRKERDNSHEEVGGMK